MKFHERTRDTVSTTAGTSNFVLDGAPPSNCNGFDAYTTVGDYIAYAAIHQSSGQWEIGRGQLAAGGSEISRLADDVYDGSSGPGALVNFSAGMIDIFESLPATQVNRQSSRGVGMMLSVGSYLR